MKITLDYPKNEEKCLIFGQKRRKDAQSFVAVFGDQIQTWLSSIKEGEMLDIIGVFWELQFIT